MPPRRRCASRCDSTPAARRSAPSCSRCRSRSRRRSGATAGRAGAARRPVRRAPPLGRHAAQRCCGRTRRVVVPPFDGRHRRRRSPSRALTTSTSPRPIPRRAADGEIPLELLFSGTVFYAGAGGALQINRISWNAEAGLPPARRDVAGDDGPLLPERAWLRLDREAFDRLVAFRAQRALTSWEAASTRCSRRRGAMSERATRPPDPRAIADAVLYEGYVLWPYRRSALKNAQRWTFGGVFPRAHSAGARGRRRPLDDADPVPRRGRRTPRLAVGVRFLHVVRRQAVDATGARSTSCAVGGERHLTWDEAVEREVALAAGAARRARRPAPRADRDPGRRERGAARRRRARRADLGAARRHARGLAPSRSSRPACTG